MSLKPTVATPSEKALGYEFYLPSKRVYDCNKYTKTPGELESLVELQDKGYVTRSVGPDCSYVIYVKNGIVYVVFKGTDSAKDFRDDTKMSATSFWSWMTGRPKTAAFMDTVIADAHAAIGQRYIGLPRRYTGHSLGGALALTAYSRHGREEDMCQIFSPYMDIEASRNISRWPKRYKIVVWAHKDDKIWRAGWSNYESANPNLLVQNRLIWHDTSGLPLEGRFYELPTHMMGNMREYFENDIQDVAPASGPRENDGAAAAPNEDTVIFTREDARRALQQPRRQVSDETRQEWVLEVDSD